MHFKLIDFKLQVVDEIIVSSKSGLTEYLKKSHSAKSLYNNKPTLNIRLQSSSPSALHHDRHF